MTTTPTATVARSPLQRVKEAVYPLTSRLVARAWVAEGALGEAGPRLRILFAHNCQFNHHLQRRTFANATISSERHLLLAQLPGIVRRNALDVDLVCAVLPRPYGALFRGLSCWRGREWVRQVIATRASWEELRKSFSKKRRQISNDFEAKNGLSCRISREAADLDLFYHRMFVPHIRRRYGELADVDDYEDVKRAFAGGGLLLFVMSEDRPVAGALSVLAGDVLMFRRTGVLDGDESYVKVGAQTALYYFQLRYAVEHGLAALDTMKSAPFLNDGVFRHKADWGARSFPDDEAERAVFLFPLGPAEKLARFFEINPIIVDEGRGLSAVVGDTTPVAAATEAVQRHQTSGLATVELFTPGGRRRLPL
jgi:hypothetical protein